MKDIVKQIKHINQFLTKNKHQLLDTQLLKTKLRGFIEKLFNEQYIDANGYKLLIDKLSGVKTDKKTVVAHLAKSNMASRIIVMLLLTTISLIGTNALFNKAKIQVEKDQARRKNNQEIVRTVNNQFDNLNEVLEQETTEQSFDIADDFSYASAAQFIIPLQGKLKGDVYKNGRIIARNVHLVYDDKLPMDDPNKVWDGNLDTLDSFINNCIGIPTIGYGTTNKSVVNKGYITDSEAFSLCKDYIIEIQPIIIKRLGGQEYWDSMNSNQKIATLSYFYNCGPYAKATKQFEAIRNQDWEEAARNMDIIKSNGKVSKGLVRRRKIEQQKFLM